MEGYRRRVLDELLARKLQAKGAVVIEGPKWCGKTTTAEEIAASKVMLTATGEHAYRRPEDGIYVVPIGCLRL